jgi:hypothetical protein
VRRNVGARVEPGHGEPADFETSLISRSGSWPL